MLYIAVNIACVYVLEVPKLVYKSRSQGRLQLYTACQVVLFTCWGTKMLYISVKIAFFMCWRFQNCFMSPDPSRVCYTNVKQAPSDLALPVCWLLLGGHFADHKQWRIFVDFLALDTSRIRTAGRTLNGPLESQSQDSRGVCHDFEKP